MRELIGLGSHDGKDFIKVVENGKETVYVGDSVDDATTFDDHAELIIAEGVEATEEQLAIFSE